MSAKKVFLKKLLLPFVLVMLLAGHAFLVNVGWEEREVRVHYKVVPKLNLEWMKFISLEQDRFVSLLLSLYLLDAIPAQSYEWDYGGLLSYMRVITGLDPYNKGPFFFAVYFMSYRTDSEGRLIFSYLDESREKFPDDWKLPWQASYVAKIRFKDNDLAYHYALKAANAPHAPPIVRILPAMLVRNIGDTESATAYLTTLRENTTDPKELEAIDEELENLQR
ncbi:MAG: hypothetical protein ABFD82_20970 [Syntrophaceae bacterium]